MTPRVTVPAWIVRVGRLVLGLIMIAAGFGKITDPAAFATQIRHFAILPAGLENLPAILLPWVEVVCGLSLLTGVRARSAAWLSAAMLVAFTLAVGSAMARGLDIECGCFGTADSTRVGGFKLIENLAFTAIAAIASLRLDPPPDAAP